MKTTILSAVLLHLLIVTSAGQNISETELRWVSNSTTDLRTNEGREYTSTFISKQGEIQWLQKNGQNVKTFAIVGQTGSWTNVANEGSITFQVSESGSAGTIVFQRSGTEITVTLDFSSLGSMAIKRRFHVTEIQPVK